MTLAPIRGAPPGAPNPPFPTAEAKPAPPITAPTGGGAQPPTAPVRQRGTPIEFSIDGVTCIFSVTPELPAIMRASMTVRVVVAGQGGAQALGVLRMSAARARVFLTDLLRGRSPIDATGDEDGTLRIAFETTPTGIFIAVGKPGEPQFRRTIDPAFDIRQMAGDLLGDLGA